jgi:RHH-type transcriptional regulator, rel operon repressor / antitoxin RelB
MSATTEPTTTIAIRMPESMKAELGALAKVTGRNRNTLVVEAVRRFIEVERWQLADIEAGLREADAGDFATTEEMDALWSKYQGQCVTTPG